MSRRTATLSISALLVIVLGYLVFVLPVPYVIAQTAAPKDTLGLNDQGSQIITVTGKTANPVTGKLLLTVVGEQSSEVTAAQALLGWIKHDELVWPRAAVIPPGTSQQQVNQQNTQDFTDSQDSATTAAACELKNPTVVIVASVATDLGANGLLKGGDEFVSVDGTAIDSAATLTSTLQTHKVGDAVTVVVNRNKVAQTVSVKLSAGAQAGAAPRLGISVTTTCRFAFTVALNLPEVQGPSGGLMFALGIMDKVGTVDLTHGQTIAGTGEITPDGKVGAIGGIALKMIAARRAGATIFLAPADNCSDVIGNIPKGLNVVKVATLDDAVKGLEGIHAGTAVPHC